MSDSAPRAGGDRLVVAVVGAPHGVRGGLRVRVVAALGAAALPPGAHAWLGGRSYEVLRCEAVPGSDRARLFLAGVDDRDAAETLRGVEVEIERGSLPDLEDDEFYLADVIGHRVRAASDRSDYGVVVGVTSNGAQDLLEIEYASRPRSRTWLLPALPHFVVAVEEDAVLVDVPTGMLPSALEPGS